ncbi:RNB domain-containing ribonuclease [Luteococcus peritonei]|uniref:RNB domain-containing ribonuclease n=1 Tax=Luteococcus peritonei TaxID=88874 RepID=A0ABW4RX42_9ACTN
MPARHISIAEQVPEQIREGLDRLRTELEVPQDFGPEVLAEAERRVAAGPLELGERADRTDLPFVTIDPEGSMDLDQAMYLQREGDGYLVWYAIADVAAWVEPGGAIDAEAQRRGQTFYAPSQRAPLHPPQLSEAAASLLSDGTARPALVWQVRLDATGAQTAATVERALVRSTERLSYTGVQQQLDAGQAPEWLLLLREIGQLRQQQEIDRGGVSLNLPEQEIVADESGWHVVFRAPLPVEDWNAQISLLTGMAAAGMMLEAGVGILRTLPPADERDVARLRRTARSLGIDWPAERDYPDFVRSLDVSQPSHLAMMTECTTLFRGAAYTVIDETTRGSNLKHNALAADYAHCTAPLRRLVDRYVGEICVHLCAGTEIPQWVLEALPALPQTMAESDRRAKKFERGVVDLTEALVLSNRIGEVFTGTLVDVDDKKGTGDISIADPATEAHLKLDGVALGDTVQVRLESVDLVAGQVRFTSA